MNKLAQERAFFIDQLNEAFLSHTGYGAYAYLSTIDSVNLFDEFNQQKISATEFIKHYVNHFFS